jgi:hypothetical protein
MQGLDTTRSQEFGYLGIVTATKDSCPRHASLGTGRLLTLQDPIQTEPALVDHAGILIVDSSIVGAGYRAILAANTCLLVDEDDATGVMVRSTGRADFRTRGVMAVLTLDRQAPASSLWNLLLEDTADETLALRQFVVLAAGLRAGTTTSALV